MFTDTSLHTLHVTHDHRVARLDTGHCRAIAVMMAAVLVLACVGLLALWPASIRSFEHAGAITDIAFSPGGQLLVAGSSDRTVQL